MVIIGNITLNDLAGVSVISFKPQPCTVTTFDEWLTGSLDPIDITPSQFNYSSIELKCLIEGDSLDDTESKISYLQSICIKNTLNRKDSEYFYAIKITSSERNRITDCACELTILLKSTYKTKAQKTIRLASVLTQSIVAEGNLETPCIYEIKATTSIIDFRINNILVRNLPINGILIINGEDGTILLNGANKFADADLNEFPSLIPGNNTITINNTNCEIKIKYKPRFV